MRTSDQRLDRYNWCTGNRSNKFHNTGFIDETSLWENECPKYAWTPQGIYQDGVEISSKSSRKLNVLCGISIRGPTRFVVSYMNKVLIIIYLQNFK